MNSSNKKIFEQYYNIFKKDVYWYVYKRISDSGIAEDITAEVFIKLLKNIEKLEEQERSESGYKAWLFTVARNQTFDYLRKIQKIKEKSVELDSDMFEVFASTDSDIVDEMVADENYMALMKEIEGLSEGEKEIMTLRLKNELNFREIAEVLERKEGAVKMSYYRAVEKLKDKFDIEENE